MEGSGQRGRRPRHAAARMLPREKMPLLPELQTLLGLGSTKMSSLTGLKSRLDAARRERRAGDCPPYLSRPMHGGGNLHGGARFLFEIMAGGRKLKVYEAGYCFKPVAVHGFIQRGQAAVQAQRRRVDDGVVELSEPQGGRRGRNGRIILWMGWPGASVPPEHEAAVRTYGAEQFKSSPVFLPEESMDRFYLGFCNKTIWPLFHYFPTLTQLRGGVLAGIPARQPRFRRGGGEGAASRTTCSGFTIIT